MSTFQDLKKVNKDEEINSEITKKTLIEFIEIAKKNNIEPYLIFLPGISNSDFANIYDSLLSEISKKMNVPYKLINNNILEKNIIDVEKFRSVENLYAYPDPHYNEYGNFIAAKAIASFLTKNTRIQFNSKAQFKNRTRYLPGHEECPNNDKFFDKK